MRDLAIVALTLTVVALLWGIARRAEQPVRTCLGFWSLATGGTTRSTTTAVVYASTETRDVADSARPDQAHSGREYVPRYRGLAEDQASLVVALEGVHEPITIQDARAVARALVVYVDLCDLSGTLTATVEPNGRVNLVRRQG